MRFFTFNILSSSYATAEAYPMMSVENIKDYKRWALIKDIIKKQMDTRSIISLQEVTEFHRSKLEAIAYNNDYHMIATNYGHFYSGYMGVATLIPREYRLVRCQLFRPATLVRKFLPATPEQEVSIFSPTYWNPWSAKPKVESYQEVLGRKENVQIMIELVFEGTRFVHTNYHAPCVYWKDNMTEAVSALSLYSALKFSGSLPLIVTGDYNMKPNEDGYNIFTGKDVNFKDSELKIFVDKMKLTPLGSSYLVANGSEPEYTVNSISWDRFTQSTSIFTGTLDYIFVSKHWKVLESEVGPDIEGYIPSVEHPSDHKYLWTSVEIPPAN